MKLSRERKSEIKSIHQYILDSRKQSPAFIETTPEMLIVHILLSEERTRTMRSFLVQAWILFPGCWALTGPREVSGPVGGSVSVQCQYNEVYQNYKKYWCRGEKWFSCSIAVQTNSSEAEVAGDRVSIQDNHTQCTFTVIMESLALGDQDVYWCGIEKSSFDDMFAVNVSVFPAVPTSPPTTPEKDLTVATSPWTEVEKSTSSFNSSDAPTGISNLVLHILIPSILLVLLLIVFIAVKFRRASQRRSKALEDTPGQKDKNVYLYNKNPGHTLPFSASDPAATGQMAIYMNKQHLPSSADPVSDYENIPLRSQVSGGREAVSSGPEHCSATDQQDTYVNRCPITPRPPMICHQAKCGRKAAG
ncbi:CMRF35-like molecule 3 isoform X2 [Dermochelys coriacea]|uniref:CMRF35-like molecule 3 isoform X2 n=2 Tax=Dermochelys coriacea TaxID=27794 RepID=UPI0018E8D0FB|nr:CMRF35-like molecule 3 isoform X2 [Dermochelys coriacea]